MTVRCAQCGEEMLGAVNRCWKCGQKLVANAEQPELPPMRMRGTPSALVIDAEIVDTEDEVYAAEPADTNATVTGDEGEDSTSDRPVQGEPPVVTAPVEDLHSVPVTSAATSNYRYPVDHPTAATGGAYGSLLLGIVGLIAAIFTVFAACLAIPGLALGAWGTSSNRRVTALIGMILCGLALLLTSYRGAVWTYEYVYGHSPWETIPAGYEEEIDTGWENEEF